MLPDSLYAASSKHFYETYGNYFPKDAGRDHQVKTKPDVQSIKTDIDKKNEIKARDKQADNYHLYGYWLHGQNEENTIKMNLNVNEDDVILELGCGTGRITKIIISENTSNYIAIDFSNKSLQLFQNDLDEEYKERILLMQADVCNLPIKNQISTKILSAQVLEHIPGVAEQNKYVREISRVLHPKGLAALTVYNYSFRKRLYKKDLKKGFHSGGIYFENFTKNEVKKLFEPYFNIQRIRGINCYFPFIRRLGTKSQRIIEKILSKSFLNSYLGEILFIGLKK